MGHPDDRTYQTRQLLSGVMGEPALQLKALPNSSKFCTVPSVRHFPELWGSVLARTRATCSVRFSHQTWPKLMKKRCAGV